MGDYPIRDQPVVGDHLFGAVVLLDIVEYDYAGNNQYEIGLVWLID